MLHFIRSSLTLVLLALHADAQHQAWIRQLGTWHYDRTFAVAADVGGGVFVAGETYAALAAPNAGGYDAWLVRYDSAGNTTWTQQYGTAGDDRAHALASDGVGGVYVTGTSNGNTLQERAFLARYDSGGAQAWLRLFGSTQVGSRWEGLALAPDDAGGTFVAGWASCHPAWIARYDAAGNQIWIRMFTVSGACAIPFALASDGVGGAFLAGYAATSPNEDAWVARYDGAGNQLWLRPFGTPAADVARALAPDGAGGVYVGGAVAGDALLARYDGAGSRLWLRSFAVSEYDNGYALASDGAGGVFFCGDTSIGAGPLAQPSDAWVVAYDSAGSQTWSLLLGTSGEDNARALAPNGTGGFFIAGTTDGSFGGPLVGGSDAWLARFDGLGVHYCPAQPSSTGAPGRIDARGSRAVANGDVTLVAGQLPLNSALVFLTSRMSALVNNPGGSQGHLCLGGSIGRYIGPGQIQSSGAWGTASLVLDLTQTPTPTGFVTIAAGETWNFQAWFRDANPTVTSNFTDAVSFTFH